MFTPQFFQNGSRTILIQPANAITVMPVRINVQLSEDSMAVTMQRLNTEQSCVLFTTTGRFLASSLHSMEELGVSLLSGFSESAVCGVVHLLQSPDIFNSNSKHTFV